MLDYSEEDCLTELGYSEEDCLVVGCSAEDLEVASCLAEDYSAEDPEVASCLVEDCSLVAGCSAEDPPAC